MRTAPMLWSDASQCIIYGLEGSGSIKTGAYVKDYFKVMKAFSHAGDHTKGVDFLVKLFNGLLIEAQCFIKCP